MSTANVTELKELVEDLQAQAQSAKAEIASLHESFERKGVNSKGTMDIFGRRFSVPVDAEHKATAMPILNFSNPHMRAFHASWFGFFSTFFSTFAAAPLTKYIKSDLKLNKDDLYLGNIMSVAGTIFSRLVMGTVCDVMGARKGLAFCLFLTCPFIIGIMFVSGPGGFIVCRLFIGCGLASFVACQVWCTQQFSKKIVGLANATAGGWGNLGGGITNLTMVFIFQGFLAATDDEKLSWRLCFLVPLALHIVSGLMALSGRDLPDGNFKELEASGAKQKSNSGVVLKVGASNVNAWILTVTYGFCFGVELTMTNVAAFYFYEYHGMTPLLSSIFASIFGLVNLCARSLGGMWSDAASAKFGMRGRIWSLWFWQSVEGALCIVMAIVTLDYDAPEDGKPLINGWAQVGPTWANEDGRWQNKNGPWTELVAPMVEGEVAPAFASEEYQIVPCGALSLKLTDGMKEALKADNPVSPWLSVGTVVLTQSPDLPGDCISNSGTVGIVVLIMFLFSVAVQMAEGLTFGVVPYVSRPALGVVSGMVGAGGNLGAVIATSIFFKGSSMRTDTGILYLGITILAVTLSCFALYFPDSGGMLFGAGKLKYDPQIIKPPANYRGADSMNYEDVNDTVGDASGIKAVDVELEPKPAATA
jgi:NNP family nitrate/nitrite transporter-like MFS transporter